MWRIKNVGTYAGGTEGININSIEQYVMLNKAVISAGVKQVDTHRCRFWVVHRFLALLRKGEASCIKVKRRKYG